jgi:4'-phosphopantetheinyl transferase
MIYINNFKEMHLDDRETHVWFAQAALEFNSSTMQDKLSFLDSDELHRYNRYKFPQKRSEYLLGRIFLKKVLSQYLNISPEKIKILYSANGKPVLESKSNSIDLQFNLSHSNFGFACAVTLGNLVGIDIEYVIPVEQKHLNHYLAPEEIAYLSDAPPAERLKNLFQIWTLKEAFLKANDLFETISPNDFYFTFEPTDIRIHTKKIQIPENWKFYFIMPADNFSLALAVQTDYKTKHDVKYYYCGFNFF